MLPVTDAKELDALAEAHLLKVSQSYQARGLMGTALTEIATPTFAFQTDGSFMFYCPKFVSTDVPEVGEICGDNPFAVTHTGRAAMALCPKFFARGLDRPGIVEDPAELVEEALESDIRGYEMGGANPTDFLLPQNPGKLPIAFGRYKGAEYSLIIAHVCTEKITNT